MVPPLDIFKLEQDGSLVWKGTVESLAVAKLSVAVLLETTPADYLIYSAQTGHKMVIKIDGSSVGP